MKRISIFSVCFAVAVAITSVLIGPTRWAARSVWYSISHPMDSEYTYFDVFALVVSANSSELKQSAGGNLVRALVGWDPAEKVQTLAEASKEFPNARYIDSFAACQPIEPDDSGSKATLLTYIKKGQEDEPDNVYYDLCEWAIYNREHDRKQAESALLRGSVKSQYNDHHQEILKAGIDAMTRLCGNNGYFTEELQWRTSTAIVLKLPERQPNESEISFFKKRLACARIIDLAGQQESQSSHATNVLGHLKSMLVGEGGSPKMSDGDALTLAKIYDEQARTLSVDTAGFSFVKAVRDQIKRSQASKPALRNDESATSFYDKCSRAMSSAAAVALSIPIGLLFLLGQRLRQHPSAAISIPLAALSPITFAFSSFNEYSAVQLACLLLGAVIAWIPPARKWLWLLILPFVGAAAACWFQYGDGISLVYKPDELILNCIIAGIGLAISLPKVQLWIAWVLSLGLIGAVLYLLSMAWSLEGTLTMDNKNLIILGSFGVLALLGPRTKVNGQALFSVAVLCASAIYVLFILMFAGAL